MNTIFAAHIKDDGTIQSVKKHLEGTAELAEGTLFPKRALPIHPLEENGFSVSFYIRMLFSCLVDGDYLDTEKFMSGASDRSVSESISGRKTITR